MNSLTWVLPKLFLQALVPSVLIATLSWYVFFFAFFSDLQSSEMMFWSDKDFQKTNQNLPKTPNQNNSLATTLTPWTSVMLLPLFSFNVAIVNLAFGNVEIDKVIN